MGCWAIEQFIGVQPPATAVVSVIATSQLITVTLNVNAAITGNALIPSNWVVLAPPGNFAPVTVTGVSVSGMAILLTTTEQTGGGAYVLSIPTSGVFSTGGTGSPLLAPYTQAFTGATTPTLIQSINVIDSRNIVLIFAKPVIASGALVPGNYAVNNGLSVTSVTQINSQTYQLGTTVQTSGTVYTLTASNIFDIFFNPI
jgi:hypothetical protein